jgi:putative flippase GtrA
MNLPLLAPMLQLGRFGVVGALATLAHALTFAAAIELGHLRPLLANFLGFGLALCVSFLGHFHWTFRAEARERGPDIPSMFLRFALVALAGLLLNSLIVVVVLERLGFDYRVAMLLMVSVVPLLLFWLCKRFAFAAAATPQSSRGGTSRHRRSAQLR